MTEDRDGELERRRIREDAAGLWPIGRALAVASVGAIVGLTLVTAVTLAVLGFPRLTTHTALSVGELLDVLKLVLGTVAGVGALAALVMNYRKQRLAEAAEVRDQRRTDDDRVRVLNERFATAAGQLGHAEPAVRLAGVYALAGLADDWKQQRKVCIEVLCAYIRMPYDPDTAPSGEREVRQSILRVIRDRLRPDAAVSWQGFAFDFTGAVFDGGDFSGVEFMSGHMTFSEARFESGLFMFGGAVFGDVTVYFGDAVISGGSLFFGNVVFLESMQGWLSFPRVQFDGGEVNFSYAKIEGGQLLFDSAQFLKSDVDFDGTDFSGGEIEFRNANFSGGCLTFEGTSFNGTKVSFPEAKFNGAIIDFSDASSLVCPPKFDSDSLPSSVRFPGRRDVQI